jgi:hypothetical protein
MQHIYEMNSEYCLSEDKNKSSSIIKQNNKRDAIDFRENCIIKDWVKTCEKSVSKNAFYCTICNEANEITDHAFIILSCNHIVHIKCLAETHFKDIYSYSTIDTEYFENRKCTTCNSSIQVEEMMYLHSKFLSNTKNLIQKHQTSIEDLELQLDHIKKELRICYDYKHKLEKDREKSKQIVSILTTTI